MTGSPLAVVAAVQKVQQQHVAATLANAGAPVAVNIDIQGDIQDHSFSMIKDTDYRLDWCCKLSQQPPFCLMENSAKLDISV